MNWYHVGVGIGALVVACLMWRRAAKLMDFNNKLSRFLFRGLAPDIDPDAPKVGAVIVGLLGIALIVLGVLGVRL